MICCVDRTVGLLSSTSYIHKGATCGESGSGSVCFFERSVIMRSIARVSTGVASTFETVFSFPTQRSFQCLSPFRRQDKTKQNKTKQKMHKSVYKLLLCTSSPLPKSKSKSKSTITITCHKHEAHELPLGRPATTTTALARLAFRVSASGTPSAMSRRGSGPVDGWVSVGLMWEDGQACE
jgi:hypothetical protein